MKTVVSQLVLGILLIASVVSSMTNGSGQVLCVSDSHVSIEQAHDQISCDDKIVCETVKCDEAIKQPSHDHCDSKKDCGDCVDFELPNTFSSEEVKAVEMPQLLFLPVSDLSLSVFTKLDDFKKYRLNEDIPLNDRSQIQAFSLSQILNL